MVFLWNRVSLACPFESERRLCSPGILCGAAAGAKTVLIILIEEEFSPRAAVDVLIGWPDGRYEGEGGRNDSSLERTGRLSSGGIIRGLLMQGESILAQLMGRKVDEWVSW